MKLINYLAALVFAVSLSSCLGETTNSVVQDFTPYTFCYVTDQQNNITSVSTDATLKLTTETNSGRIDINITNLKLPSGAYVNLELKDLGYTITDNGAQRISVPAYTSVVDGVSHTITSFTMDLYLRYLNTQAYYLMVCSYVIDSQYSVRVVYTPACYWGTTTVTDQDGKTYVNTNQTSFYGISFSPDKSRASLGCINAKFAEQMPAMSMNFDNVPFTANQYAFSLESNELTPTIGSVPFPSYKITDLKVRGNYDGPVTVEFTCTIDTEKVKGSYKVSAYLGVMPLQNSSN